MIREQICKRCGYHWYPKTHNKPVTCARCRSPYWDKERTTTRGEENGSNNIEEKEPV